MSNIVSVKSLCQMPNKLSSVSFFKYFGNFIGVRVPVLFSGIANLIVSAEILLCRVRPVFKMSILVLRLAFKLRTVSLLKFERDWICERTIWNWITLSSLFFSELPIWLLTIFRVRSVRLSFWSTYITWWQSSRSARLCSQLRGVYS